MAARTSPSTTPLIISPRGQITLPKPVRARLRLAPGSVLLLREDLDSRMTGQGVRGSRRIEREPGHRSSIAMPASATKASRTGESSSRASRPKVSM